MSASMHDPLINTILRILVVFCVQGFFVILLFRIDSDRVKPTTVLLFSVVMTIVQLVPTYLIFDAVSVDASGNSTMPACLYTVPPPYMILCYYFYTHITYSKARSKNMALVLYYALLLEAIIATILQCYLLYDMAPIVPIGKDGHVEVFNILVTLSMIPLSGVAYFGLKIMIADLRKYSSTYNATIESRKENHWASVTTITCIACVVYGLCFYAILQMAKSKPSSLWISLALLMFTGGAFGFIYLRLKVIFRDSIIESQNVYIASLLKNLDDFSGIRHDIGNILHVYGGYIHLTGMPELQDYHTEVVKTFALPNKNMSELKKARANPVILGLLSAKLHAAEQSHVTFSYTLMDDCNIASLRTLVFGRILGILLDNAIEGAAASEKKAVHLEMEQVYDYVSITITNSTLDDVDVSKITIKGYTSKPDHSGQGLWEIYKMITRNEGFSVHFYYADNRFTACVKVELRHEASEVS